jgi:hypothetical protein
MSMSDRELIDAAQRDVIREIVGELLEERALLAGAKAEAANGVAAEELSKIRRAHLTPKQKSALIDRIGPDAYLALEWDDPAPPRDDLGRFRSRW